MQKITEQGLIDLINGIAGATFVSLDIETEPRMRKTSNPYTGAKKLVKLNGGINVDYGNSVNSQLTREGVDAEFTPQPRKWGEKTGNWITHKDSYYLEVKVQSSSDPVYKAADGSDIITESIKPFLYKSSTPHTQGDLEKKIILRDVKIKSIRRIRVKGEEYEVVANDD